MKSARHSFFALVLPVLFVACNKKEGPPAVIPAPLGSTSETAQHGDSMPAKSDAAKTPSASSKAEPSKSENAGQPVRNQYADAIRRMPWNAQAVADFANSLDKEDEARAKLVRLQLELSQLEYNDPRRSSLSKQVQALIAVHKTKWSKGLEKLGKNADVAFEVGLIDRVTIENAEDKDAASLATVTELRALSFNSPKMTAAGFERIARLPNLESLTIEGDQAIAKEELAPLAKLPPWTVVRIHIDGVDRAAMQALEEARIARLDKLTPDEKHSAGVRFLRAMSENRHPYGRPTIAANLGQTGITDNQMRLLAHVPELEIVYISDSDITSKGVAHLAAAKNLKDLGLWQTKVNSISALAGLTKLEKLGIFPEFDTKMGDKGLEGLQNFTELRELYLNDESISDETVKRLAGLSKLRKLDVSAPNMKDDESLAALAGLTELQSLSFHGGKVSDKSLRHLAGLKQLETLSINVSDGTGAGFKHMAGLEKLKYLFVNGHGANDESVSQLAGLKGLATVMAQGSDVTKEGATRLAAKLPRVTIILDKDVVKSPREAYSLRRVRLGDKVSIQLPADWNPDERASEETVWAREDGWEKIGSYSGGVVGPAEIHMYQDDHSKSAKEAMMASVNNNAHLNPKILKSGVQAIGAAKDAESCVYQNDHSKHLVCAAKIGGKCVVLSCQAPPARFAEFENLFLAVAKSVRLGDDPKIHANETSDLKTDKAKGK